MKSLSCILLFLFLSQQSKGQTGNPGAAGLLDTSSFRQVDSVKLGFQADTVGLLTNRLDSIENKLTSQVDSVQQFYSKKTAKLRSITSRFQQKSDSLTALNLPTTKYTQKIDSLNRSVVSLQTQMTEGLDSIRQKFIAKLGQLHVPPELQNKVSKLTSKIQSVSLPTSEALTRNVEIGQLGNPLQKLSTSLNIPQVEGLSSVGLPDMKNLTPDPGQATDITQQAGSLQGTIDNATTGALNETNGIDNLAAKQASRLEEVKLLQEQSGNSPLAGLSSEEQANATLKDQAKSVALNHFAGKEEQLTKAMESLSKYKNKYTSVAQIGDLPRRPPNEMKGKPLIERVVPGFNLQIQKKGDDFMVDFNPYAGYRFTGRITGGFGWNQRVAYSFKNGNFNPTAKIFGPRVFGEFKLGKGFYPRAEIETMYTLVPPQTQIVLPDLRSREWVWGAFIGMRKEYRFIKRVKGTASVMMRVFDPHHKSPYQDVVNARIGFEFPMKKKNNKG